MQLPPNVMPLVGPARLAARGANPILEAPAGHTLCQYAGLNGIPGFLPRACTLKTALACRPYMFRVRNLVNTTTTTYYYNETHMHVHVAEREWSVKARRAQRKAGSFKKRNEKREEKVVQKKRSTGPSCVVPHRSTTPAGTCLTSLFGWEAVSQADVAALSVKEEKHPIIGPPVPLAVLFVWGP